MKAKLYDVALYSYYTSTSVKSVKFKADSMCDMFNKYIYSPKIPSVDLAELETLIFNDMYRDNIIEDEVDGECYFK